MTSPHNTSPMKTGQCFMSMRRWVMLPPPLTVILKMNPTKTFCLMSGLFCLFLLTVSKRLKLPALLKTVWSGSQTPDSSPLTRPEVCVALKYQWTSTNRGLQNLQPQPFNPALFSFTVMKMDFFPSQHTEAPGWHGAQCKLWWCERTCHVNKTRGRWVRAAQSENRVD